MITDGRDAEAGRPERKVRVLCVEMNEDGTTGGSHVVMRDLVRGLEAPFEPVALFYQDNPVAASLRAAGIEVVTWDSVRLHEVTAMRTASKLGKCRALLAQIQRRREFMISNGIDLVHLGNSPFAGCDDWLPAAKLARRACVVYSMGAANGGDRFRRLTIRGYDRILPNSKYLLQSLRRVGIRPDHLVLAYPGLDIAEVQRRVSRSRDDVRRDLQVDAQQLLVVMVGNIREWKGQHLAIEAIAALPTHLRAAVRMMLVGATAPDDEAYERHLREMLMRDGLTDTVTLLGHRTDVHNLLNAADIAVHASTKPEPFGLVVLEAMAHRCAIIAAAAGGPGEMLDETSGILVDTASSIQLRDGLERLIADPALRARYAAEAARRATLFSRADHLRTVTTVYRELIPDG